MKSISGASERQGSTIKIGDNRYGMREAYDPEVDKATKEFYRKGDEVKVVEVKNKKTGSVKTVKP